MRLFIGIKVAVEDLGHWPEHLRKLKLSFGRHHVEVRWVAPGDYHITLAFLGEQSEKSLGVLAQIIDEMAETHSVIQTEAHGMGGFPGVHSSRVIWIGVQNKKALRGLQTDLVGKLADRGFQLPAENFVPHVTIGRLRNLQSVKSLIDPHLRKPWGALRISEITLFKSELFGAFRKFTPLYSRALPMAVVTRELEPACVE
jgi:2'-5' RNA ligase